MIESQTQLTVRYAETDAMGIVYHSNYLVWFEIARVGMLSEIGLPYRELEAKGCLLPVIEARARYRAPARFDDTIVVRCRIDECPKVKIAIEYEVFKEEQKLVTGSTSHAFMDREARVIKPPAFFMDTLRAYF